MQFLTELNGICILYSHAGRIAVSVTSDLRTGGHDYNIYCSLYTLVLCYLVCEVIVFQRKKILFVDVIYKHRLDGNMIGDEGGVALGEALKVNMTLQTLK